MIYLYGAYGIGNLGDDLILLGALQDYALDSVRIVCYGKPSINVDVDWISESDFKNRKEFFLKENDLLVFAGGGLFWADVHIYEMLDLARCAKKVGAKVYLQKVGFQGLHLAPDAVKELCNIADAITVRDFDSICLARNWFIDSNITHSPDFVFSLKEYVDKKRKTIQEKKLEVRPKIGINHSNVNFYHVKEHRDRALDLYAQVINNYHEKIDFVYIPQVRHKNVIAQNDILYGEYFWQKTKGAIGTLSFPKNVDDLLNIYCELDAIIAWRYHSLVLGNVLDIPTLLFADMNRDKYQSFAKENAIPHIDFNLNDNQILWAFNCWIDRFLLNSYKK